MIQDSGDGSITKTGAGTLKLGGNNSYHGGTRVRAGGLAIHNRDGSATGGGLVQVDAGILAGDGIISGAVTIGTGKGEGALLAPSQGAGRPTILTLQSSLTLKADASYRYRLNLKKTKSDLVVANGVTIESGAQFNFQSVGRGRVRAGKVATVLANTAATPIAGTFANLPEGSTLEAGGNTLQVSYHGGDGNDLTLTVVP
ncbi:MAG: autotransporter-associated beta strand repeat-containing protein [Chthoniobacterales bacterium]